MKKYRLGICIAIVCLFGCAKPIKDNDYQKMTMTQAQELFTQPDDYIILDVRTVEEYNDGHIPNAINIPNESIDESVHDLLPDYSQTIYVYCRSGNRSQQASGKLAMLGYTDIIEIGGIQDWTGNIENTDQSTRDSIQEDNIIGFWTDQENKYTLLVTKNISYHALLKKEKETLYDADFTLHFDASTNTFIFDDYAGIMLNADCTHYNHLHQISYHKDTNQMSLNMTYQSVKLDVTLCEE